MVFAHAEIRCRVNGTLPFDQRACFVAGQAKSGTTLLVALLDGHPELLVLPEETAYFATVLTKYAPMGRRAQVNYITQQSLSNVLFGGACKWGKRDYSHFPRERFLALFEQTAFDPSFPEKDLLVAMVEAYAEVLDVRTDSITRWVEKTPANRNYIPQIIARFPQAKILVTMRDPRAALAAQIALEGTRRLGTMSVYYVVAHWLATARLALQAEAGEIPALVIRYEDLVSDPAAVMRRVCAHLEISYTPDIVLRPTKIGREWAGNSAAETKFDTISAEPATRWQHELSENEIGWVEWHCRDLMPHFGFQPSLAHGSWSRHWARPIRRERPWFYVKSRYYSARDALKSRF